MSQPLEHARLVLRARPERRRVDLVRAQELGDDERAQPLVPGEPGLVAVAAAEQPDGVPARRDLVPFVKPRSSWARGPLEP